MVYYSHSLSSPEIIFEFVLISKDLFHYYRIYNSHIGLSSAYALIYHQFYGTIIIQEYDALKNNFNQEILNIYKEEDTEEESTEEESTEEESTEEESTEEEDDVDDKIHISNLPCAASLMMRNFNNEHYRLALSDIMKCYYLSQNYTMDYNYYAHTYNYQCYHFYRDLYVTNLLTKYDDLGQALSAHFLIKIKDELFQLDYSYQPLFGSISANISQIMISI